MNIYKKLGAAVVASALAAIAMAQVAISNLPPATLPLSGGEQFPLVQGGVTKRAPANSIGFGNAPITSSYVLLDPDLSLPNSRKLVGTTSEIILTDGGPNGLLVLSTPQDIGTSAIPVFNNMRLTGIQGILKSGIGVNFAAANASDIVSLWTGCSASAVLLGNGTCGTAVTSIGLTAPSVFAVSGSPVISGGSIGLAFAGGQPANQVLATPNGSAGPLGLRALASADIPAIALTTVGPGGVAGILQVVSGGTGAANLTGILKGNGGLPIQSAGVVDVTNLWTGPCTASTFLRGDGTCFPAAGTGTVTSVGLTMPSGFTVTGSPVTGSSTLGVTTALSGVLKGTGTGFTTAASIDIRGLWSGTCSAATFLRGDGTCIAAGTVTSVGLTVPSGLSVTGSPVTGASSLAITTALNGVLKGNGTGFTTSVAADIFGLWSGCSASNFLRGDGVCIAPSAGSPGGSNTQVQYNSSGSFAGDAGLTWNPATTTLTTKAATAPAFSQVIVTDSLNHIGALCVSSTANACQASTVAVPADFLDIYADVGMQFVVGGVVQGQVTATDAPWAAGIVNSTVASTTGCSVATNGTVRLNKSGNIVALNLSGFSCTWVSSFITLPGLFPAGYRPLTQQRMPCSITNASVEGIGLCLINTNGNLQVLPYSGAFSGAIGFSQQTLVITTN